MLASLGWNSQFAAKFKQIAPSPGAVPGRVLADYGADYLVHDGESVLRREPKQADAGAGQ